MAAALPLGKLMGVMVKTISKPVANQLKSYAKNSKAFEGYGVALGNRIHRLQVAIFRRSHADAGGSTSTRKIKDLPDDKALDIGASFVSETFIFLVAAGITVNEYVRSKAKDAAKAATAAEDKRQTEAELEAAVTERDRKINILMDALPRVEKSVEELRQEQETMRSEMLKVVRLIASEPPQFATQSP